MSRVVLFLALAVYSVSGDNVKLGDKWDMFIPSRGMNSGVATWTLTADPGSTVKVFCSDWRFTGNDVDDTRCQSSAPLLLTVRVVFDDGLVKRSFCGSQDNIVVIGKSSKMTMQVTLPDRTNGIIECMGKAVHPPKYENVIVDHGRGITSFSWPETRKIEQEKAWRFISNSDRRLSLQCKVRIDQPVRGGECVREILTVDIGEGPKQYCNYLELNTFSIGREITMRLELFAGKVASFIDCKVQAVSGPNLNEIDNVGPPPDDDSSEIGVVPGKKSTTCDCGRTNKQSSRVINGTEVSHEGKFPFMVSMRSRGDSHYCGASILSPVHILTAAHCVSDIHTKNRPYPEEMMPTVGAHSSRKDSSHGEQQRLKVKKVSVPDEWFKVNHSVAADIAILHLETPIRFSKWVGAICLTPEEPPIVNQYIKAMGWGNTEDGYPDILREADVLVLDKALCHDNNKEICFRSGRTSTCNGDSGGPYVWADPETNRYTQVALVSYGEVAEHGNPFKCDGKRFAGTSTAYWYDWIEKRMAETSTDYSICRKRG